MGWFSKIFKKVKNVFKKVTKAVKKIVKGVGKTAKKIWNGVKKTAKKFGQKISKLGPVANIAMGMIPGFGQLWSAYGIWGAMAKGALTGFITSGGNVKGALLGAAGGGLGYGYSKLPGTSLSEKISNAFKLGEGTDTLTNSYNKFAPYKGNPGRGSDAYGFAEVDLNKQLKGTNYWNNRAMTMNGGEYAEGLTLKPNDYASILTGVDANAMKHQKRLDRTPLDKIAQGLSNFSMPAKDSYQVPIGTYDTGPGNEYALNAAKVAGQTGTGQDVYDVEKLGLLSAVNRMRKADEQFLV